MPQYRVCNPDGEPIEQAELNDSGAAYDWFRSITADDSLGYRLEVDSGGDGDWRMLDSADVDTGSSPHPS